MPYITLLSFAAYNYQTIFDIMVYGSRIGQIKNTRKKLTIDTMSGVVTIPSITLPSLDWDMRFYVNANMKVGMHDSVDVIDTDSKFVQCKINKDILICEYLYPRNIANDIVQGCIISPFDDSCYIFTLNENTPIDYLKHCNEFNKHLEGDIF